jgi:hypothetical protein
MSLHKIQQRLNAPKGQTNSFGGYKYRSAEDILTAVKPLLDELEWALVLTDNMIEVGGRVYVEAKASLYDYKRLLIMSTTACAREALTKKGMDDAQITGACSSYARKYALNGLFAIDDTKDADTDAYSAMENKTKSTGVKKKTDEEMMTQFKTAMDEAANMGALKFQFGGAFTYFKGNEAQQKIIKTKYDKLKSTFGEENEADKD